MPALPQAPDNVGPVPVDTTLMRKQTLSSLELMMRRGFIVATVLPAALFLVSCGRGVPDLPEFANRKGNEAPMGQEIPSDVDHALVLLPDGNKVLFARRLTHHGFFDESVKTLTVVFGDGTEKSFDFGQWHSGYNAIEIRCSDDLSKIWVIDAGARHMYSGAAIDLTSGQFFPEVHGAWPAPWARPDTGKLALRKCF